MFFFFDQKAACDVGVLLVGSEMCIGDGLWGVPAVGTAAAAVPTAGTPHSKNRVAAATDEPFLIHS